MNKKKIKTCQLKGFFKFVRTLWPFIQLRIHEEFDFTENMLFLLKDIHFQELIASTTQQDYNCGDRTLWWQKRQVKARGRTRSSWGSSQCKSTCRQTTAHLRKHESGCLGHCALPKGGIRVAWPSDQQYGSYRLQ